VQQRLGFIAQRDGAHAAIGGGHQDGAERALRNREANLLAIAAAAIGAGHHAERGIALCIETRIGVEAASYIAAVTLPQSGSVSRTRCARSAPAYALGVSPVTRLKRR